MLRAKGASSAIHIKFMAGLNEDLAATALWGSQQAELRGEGKYDGVFGVWYGKGPGVDRTGDVFRHANHAGTSKHGGVLALMGDDHTCESSTCAHQSEFAFVDYMMPVLNPAGVQEILDYGISASRCRATPAFGSASSASRTTSRPPLRSMAASTAWQIKMPRESEFAMPRGRPQHPPGRLGTRQGSAPARAQARGNHRLRPRQQASIASSPAAARTRRSASSPCGKSYLDMRQALEELGMDEVQRQSAGSRASTRSR